MTENFEQISLKPGFMKHNGGLFFKTISENEYHFKTIIKENHLNAAGITHGGFISALASGKSKTDSLIYGSSLGSICVEGFGPEAILNASEEDINHRINYLKSKLNS